MCGCETWASTKIAVNKITHFNECLIRKIVRIIREDKIRNEDLWKREEQASMEEDIGKGR